MTDTAKPDRPSGEALPKQELLIKLLGMTNSSNDGEALVALRKSNELLKAAGWSWEKLIRGKITVVADPFAQTKDPLVTNKREDGYSMASAGMSTPGRPPPPIYTRANKPAPPPKAARQPDPFATPRPGPMPNAPFAPPPKPDVNWGATPVKPAAKNYSIKPNRYEGYCYCCGDLVGQHGGFIFQPALINHSATQKWQIICKTCNANGHVPTSPAPRKHINHSASTNSL